MCVEFCNDGKCYLDLISKVFLLLLVIFVRCIHVGFFFSFLTDKQLWHTPSCCAEMINLDIRSSFNSLCKLTTTPI